MGWFGQLLGDFGKWRERSGQQIQAPNKYFVVHFVVKPFYLLESNIMRKFFNQRSAIAASIMASVAASSQAAIDTASVTAALTEAGAAAAVVGAAVLVVVVGIKAFKFIRGAL